MTRDMLQRYAIGMPSLVGASTIRRIVNVYLANRNPSTPQKTRMPMNGTTYLRRIEAPESVIAPCARLFIVEYRDGDDENAAITATKEVRDVAGVRPDNVCLVIIE